MLRSKPASVLSWFVLAAVLVCIGCGGGSGSSSMQTPAVSPAQAQAVSHEIVQAVVSAVSSSFSLPAALPQDGRPSLSEATSAIRPDASGCTVTPTGESCNFPLSYTGPCPQAGTIGVSGDISGNLSNSGSGSINTQITVTPANCEVSNLTINGDPNVMMNGQINFTNSALTFPITLSETGGISYGPNPSGSCQLKVTYTVNSQTSCTASGTVCGQSVTTC